MKVSRSIVYAVRAISEIARSGSNAPVPNRLLASGGRIPERYSLQLMRHLVTRGILRSSLGVNGGYSMQRPLEEISLLELIEAVEGPLVPGIAFSERGGPSVQGSNLLSAIESVTARSRRQLQEVKLSDLVASRSDFKSN